MGLFSAVLRPRELRLFTVCESSSVSSQTSKRSCLARTTPEPTSDAEDDFETKNEGLAARDAEYEAAVNSAVTTGVPARRSGRAGVATATAAMERWRRRARSGARAHAERLVLVSYLAHYYRRVAVGPSFSVLI